MAKSSTEIIIGKDTKYAVVLRVEATGGRGFSAFVYGGDKPHVGAIALVSPKGEVQANTLGDKNSAFDEEIAVWVASAIQDAFREPCACSAGVELKGATDKEITQLRMNYKAAVRHFIGTYDRTN